MALWRPFEENIDNQSDVGNNAYSPTQSVHSLSDMDHNHNLWSSSYPPSFHGNSDLEHASAKTLPQDLAVKSDAFISIPQTPITVHLITPMGYDDGCESSAKSSDIYCVIIAVQNVKSEVNKTKGDLLDVKNQQVVPWVLKCKQVRTNLSFI